MREKLRIAGTLVGFFIILFGVSTSIFVILFGDVNDRIEWFTRSNPYISLIAFPLFSLFYLFRGAEMFLWLQHARKVGLFRLDFASLFGGGIFAFSITIVTLFGSVFDFNADYASPFFASADNLWISASWFIEGTVKVVIEAFDVTFQGAEATNNIFVFNTLEMIFRMWWGVWLAYVGFSVLATAKRAWQAAFLV